MILSKIFNQIACLFEIQQEETRKLVMAIEEKEMPKHWSTDILVRFQTTIATLIIRKSTYNHAAITKR